MSDLEDTVAVDCVEIGGWTIRRGPAGALIVQDFDGSGVVVHENDESSIAIAAAIFYRIAKDLLQ